MSQTVIITNFQCRFDMRKKTSSQTPPMPDPMLMAPQKTPAWILRALEGRTPPGIAQGVPTGLAIELLPGYEAQVRPRSGMALKHSRSVNFGTIDPGYRGEIRVVMFNLGRADYTIEKGDRIAQLISRV